MGEGLARLASWGWMGPSPGASPRVCVRASGGGKDLGASLLAGKVDATPFKPAVRIVSLAAPADRVAWKAFSKCL